METLNYNELKNFAAWVLELLFPLFLGRKWHHDIQHNNIQHKGLLCDTMPE